MILLQNPRFCDHFAQRNSNSEAIVWFQVAPVFVEKKKRKRPREYFEAKLACEPLFSKQRESIENLMKYVGNARAMFAHSVVCFNISVSELLDEFIDFGTCSFVHDRMVLKIRLSHSLVRTSANQIMNLIRVLYFNFECKIKLEYLLFPFGFEDDCERLMLRYLQFLRDSGSSNKTIQGYLDSILYLLTFIGYKFNLNRQTFDRLWTEELAIANKSKGDTLHKGRFD